MAPGTRPPPPAYLALSPEPRQGLLCIPNPSPDCAPAFPAPGRVGEAGRGLQRRQSPPHTHTHTHTQAHTLPTTCQTHLQGQASWAHIQKITWRTPPHHMYVCTRMCTRKRAHAHMRSHMCTHMYACSHMHRLSWLSLGVPSLPSHHQTSCSVRTGTRLAWAPVVVP